MIKAVILDLDNCLAPVEGIAPSVLEPMLDAIRRANEGTLSEQALEQAFADCCRLPFDVVAEKYGFSESMFKAGWAAGVRLVAPPRMQGYPDLPALADLPVPLFLVTTGFRKLQESKVKALGFSAEFEAVYVDAIDEPGRRGKQGLFREIIDHHGFEPHEVLVVGDNPESEIEAGNRLGIPTVQILRPGIAAASNATHYIHELRGLLPIIEQAKGPARPAR